MFVKAERPLLHTAEGFDVPINSNRPLAVWLSFKVGKLILCLFLPSGNRMGNKSSHAPPLSKANHVITSRSKSYARPYHAFERTVPNRLQ